MEYNNTCLECNITYCAQCQEPNVCSRCKDSFSLVAEDTTCECGTGTTLYNDFCYTCDVANCLTCNATNKCMTCSSQFIVTSLGTCGCAAGKTVYENSCV